MTMCIYVCGDRRVDGEVNSFEEDGRKVNFQLEGSGKRSDRRCLAIEG